MKQTSQATEMTDPTMRTIPLGGTGLLVGPLRGKDLPDELFSLKSRPLVFAGETHEPSYRLFIWALFIMCIASALVAVIL